MTMTLISPKIKKRFPTLNHYVECGLLSEEEVRIMEELDNEYPTHAKFWLPLAWASSVTTRARHEGIIKDDHSMTGILENLNEFRTRCSALVNFDWINIPLVYTQVVTLAVYGYFIVKVIGCQFVANETGDTDTELWIFSFPFMPIVEFFFYMGWLKVAEALINPFGDDDDDFEIMWMIDRHVQVCYLLVDRIHQDHPKLMKDAYWEEIAPITLPYTVASQEYITEFPECSTSNINVKPNDQEIVIAELVHKVDSPNQKNGWAFWRKGRKSFKARKGIPLKRVDTGYDQLDQISITNDTRHQPQPSPVSKQTGNCDDFEALKSKRMKRHKNKVMKYLEIIKCQTSMEEKLVEELFHKIE